MRMGIYNFIFVAIKNASRQHCAVLLEELDDLGHAMACTFVAPLQYITYIFVALIWAG